jgi:hypothetical protein
LRKRDLLFCSDDFGAPRNAHIGNHGREVGILLGIEIEGTCICPETKPGAISTRLPEYVQPEVAYLANIHLNEDSPPHSLDVDAGAETGAEYGAYPLDPNGPSPWLILDSPTPTTALDPAAAPTSLLTQFDLYCMIVMSKTRTSDTSDSTVCFFQRDLAGTSPQWILPTVKRPLRGRVMSAGPCAISSLIGLSTRHTL